MPQQRPILPELGLTPGTFIFCTVHRAGNTDDRSRLESIVSALEASGWNLTEAAAQLRIPLRTLSHKIKAYEIERKPKGAPS